MRGEPWHEAGPGGASFMGVLHGAILKLEEVAERQVWVARVTLSVRHKSWALLVLRGVFNRGARHRFGPKRNRTRIGWLKWE